ncbi:Pao retrotransposon peptidase family protein [Dirofilaria immitis]|nr:Pao retrotransposon peptidase family protein [Dirofilaria immitis]
MSLKSRGDMKAREVIISPLKLFYRNRWICIIVLVIAARLESLIKRLQNDERLLIMYEKIINDQLQSNIIEKVNDETDQAGIIHYLIRHEIITSTHLEGMKSLYDVLYRGPIIFSNLARILLCFRKMEDVIIAN